MHFLGGLAKDGIEAKSFCNVFIGLQARQGLLLTPFLVRLDKSEQFPYFEHRTLDSATMGDILANRWNLYAFGEFDIHAMMLNVRLQPPSSFHRRYAEVGVDCADDNDGFAQVFNIPHSMGKEIHIIIDQGQWVYRRDSLYQGMSHRSSLNNAWRWPIIPSTGTAPNIGQRIAILGGLRELHATSLQDDGFTNDALWRLTPLSIWRTALVTATHSSKVENAPMGIGSLQNPACTTGGGMSTESMLARERRITYLARTRLSWHERLRTSQVRHLGRITWPNVQSVSETPGFRRASLPMGPNGTVGRCTIKRHGLYPGSSALSETHTLDDEDFTAQFTWPSYNGHRYSSTELASTNLSAKAGGFRALFSYKRI